jgi:hypothetical protein
VCAKINSLKWLVLFYVPLVIILVKLAMDLQKIVALNVMFLKTEMINHFLAKLVLANQDFMTLTLIYNVLHVPIGVSLVLLAPQKFVLLARNLLLEKMTLKIHKTVHAKMGKNLNLHSFITLFK